MVPADDGFHIIDLLGRQHTDDPVDWSEAEAALETLGIGYLAGRYSLRLSDGVERRVRIGEVSSSGIIVVADDFGSASAVGGETGGIRAGVPCTGESAAARLTPDDQGTPVTILDSRHQHYRISACPVNGGRR